jgi:hypothetical protein
MEYIKSRVKAIVVYSPGLNALCLLSSAARRFASSLRWRLAVVGRVGLRGGELCCNSSRRAAMRSKAISRLACCDRRSVAVTLIPLGRCVSRTPVSTLLRCCPPGPLAMKNSRSESRSRESRSVGYTSGKMYSLFSLANVDYHYGFLTLVMPGLSETRYIIQPQLREEETYVRLSIHNSFSS